METLTNQQRGSMESRGSSRFWAPHTVRCEDKKAHNPFYTVIKDVSEGGFRMVAESPIAIDTELDIDINLISERFRSSGRVRWCSEKADNGRFSVGVQFSDLSEEQLAKLHSFLHNFTK
jgi:c-di-GMP-binding flagellar brake protein YcgR